MQFTSNQPIANCVYLQRELANTNVIQASFGNRILLQFQDPDGGECCGYDVYM